MTQTLTTARYVITGNYRDNGRFFLNSRVTLDMKVENFGTSTPDPQFGIFGTEATAKRVIDRMVKGQERTGFIDWTDLTVEEAE